MICRASHIVVVVKEACSLVQSETYDLSQAQMWGLGTQMWRLGAQMLGLGGSQLIKTWFV